MRVRRLAPGEQALLERMRLRALADAPDAFGQRLADAEARPRSYWLEMARSVTEPGRHAVFLAEESGDCAGLVFGLLEAANPHAGRVGGMWVVPEVRGRGVGRALLEAVITWARGRAFTRLTLWVTEDNGPARRLYAARGFRETGGRAVSPSNPALHIVEMALAIPEPDAGAAPRAGDRSSGPGEARDPRSSTPPRSGC